MRLTVATLTLTVGLAVLTLSAQEANRPSAGEARPSSRGPISFEATTLAKDPAEQKILDVLKDIHATQRQGSMSVPEQDGRILRLLAEALDAKVVAELGT